MQTNMRKAKDKPSQLIELALIGGGVIIARAGKPSIRLVPCQQMKERVRLTRAC